MRFLLALAVMAGAWAQTKDASSPESAGLLERIKQRALEELASVPNYVCVDSIERSLSIPGERSFRRLDRLHVELAHIEGADRFSWLGNSTFQSRSPTAMIGYGASFGGDFADNRGLVFKNSGTKISYAGRVTMDGRPALRYDYDDPRGALGVANGTQTGFASARGSFWIDPETLDLLQIDIEGYAIPTNVGVQSISDNTTYWRVLIGNRSVLLAHSSEFRLTYADGTTRRNASVFSNCREYTADSTLTFGSSAEVQLPPPLPPGVENSRVPPGLQLQLVLDKPLDANEAAVGDPIRAHVLEGAGGVPRGARVYGRVNRIVNFNDQIPRPRPEQPPPTPKQEAWGRQHTGEVLIQIEFSQIEYRGSRAPFTARLIDLVSQPGKADPEIRSFGYLDDDAVVRYDPPGTASIYVSQEAPVLGRGVIMQWVTASERGVVIRDRHKPMEAGPGGTNHSSCRRDPLRSRRPGFAVALRF
jgi:hypothetical protein